MLEAYAFEGAACSATVEQIRHLQSLHMEMLDAARANDLCQYVQKDLQWRKTVWGISGNEYLEPHLEGVVLPLFAFSSVRFEDRGSFDLLEGAQTHSP